MGVTLTVQLILWVYIHIPCHSGELIMKHAYLSRMKVELSTHCPYATTCKYTSADSTYDETGTVVPGRPDRISCCLQCDCGPLCERRRQCCPEKLLELYSDGEAVDEIAFECEMPYFKIPALARKPYVFEGIFMTDRCLESGEWSYEDRMKCENRNISNIEEMIPVESEETKTIYVNKYCAACNAGDDTMVTWAAYVGPSDQSGSPSVMQKYSLLHWKDIYKLTYDPDSELNMSFMSPFTVYGRAACMSPVITDCNVTGLWQSYDPFYEFACKVYRVNYYDVHSNHSLARVFGNVFCAICNGLPPAIKECNIPLAETIQYGYLALINYKDSVEFSTSLAGPPLDAATKLCPYKDFHDPLNGICRPWLCPKGYRYNGTACIATISSFVGGCLLFVVQVGPIPHDSNPVDDELERLAQTLTSNLFLTDNQASYMEMAQVSRYIREGANGAEAYLVYTLSSIREVTTGKTTRLFVEAFMETMLSSPMVSVEMNGTNIAMTVNYIHSVRIDSVRFNMHGVGTNIKLVNISDGSTLDNIYRARYMIILQNKEAPVRKIDFCTTFILQQDEYVTLTDCSIRLQQTNAVFYCTQYDAHVESSIRLCVDDFLEAIQTTSNVAPFRCPCNVNVIVVLILAYVRILHASEAFV